MTENKEQDAVNSKRREPIGSIWLNHELKQNGYLVTLCVDAAISFSQILHYQNTNSPSVS